MGAEHIHDHHDAEQADPGAEDVVPVGSVTIGDRTPAGYRLYTGSDVAVLSFIRHARTRGLHLDDIADILAIRHGGAAPCAAVAN